MDVLIRFSRNRTAHNIDIRIAVHISGNHLNIADIVVSMCSSDVLHSTIYDNTIAFVLTSRDVE